MIAAGFKLFAATLKYAAAATAAMKKIVLLDTNFLLIPAQFRVDIFAELQRLCNFSYEAAVLAATVDELEGIIGNKAASAKDRNAAKLGLQLMKAKGVKIIGVDKGATGGSALIAERKVFKSTDKAILDFAASGRGSVVVATQDRLLREKLKSAGVAVVVLREKQYLKFF